MPAQAFLRVGAFASLLLLPFIPNSLASEAELKALREQIARLQAEHRQLQKREAELQKELAQLRAAQETEPVVTEKEPPRRWESSLAFGATFNSGNTESSQITMALAATRKREDDQLAFKLDGQYGENRGQRNAERILGSAQYDRDITPDAYWLGRVTGEYDAVKDLDYRFTLGPGIGYRLINRDNLLLSWETGPGFQAESVADRQQFFPQWRGAQKLEWRINSRFKLFQNAEVLFNPFDLDERNASIALGAESSITDRLALRVVAQDRYQFNVPPDRKQHDFSLTSSVVWNF